MMICPYISADCSQMAQLFYDTVHQVCAKDYTKAQLNAWATGQVDLAAWDRSFSAHLTLVALDGPMLIGFGDIDATGYLDRLYVHKDYQRKGIATALCDRLEQAFPHQTITTHASITAKGFFLQRGYRVIRAQEVVRNGLVLKNFVMEKSPR